MDTPADPWLYQSLPRAISWWILPLVFGGILEAEPMVLTWTCPRPVAAGSCPGVGLCLPGPSSPYLSRSMGV